MTTFDQPGTLPSLDQEVRISLLDAQSGEGKAGQALGELRKRIEGKGVDWWPRFANNFVLPRVRAATLMRVAGVRERLWGGVPAEPAIRCKDLQQCLPT